MKLVMLVVVGVMMAGCVTYPVAKVELTDAGNKVRVFHKTDPPISCEEIRLMTVATGKCDYNQSGAATSKWSTEIGNFAASYNLFRNEIAIAGGNAGMMEYMGPPHRTGCHLEHEIVGFAYKCPESLFIKK